MLQHDIFYNRERNGYEELTSYLPIFWKEILEMRANNNFAGYTLDRMAADIEQLIRDQFFDTCSEEKVLKYERFLGIDNAEKETEERRKLLKMAWQGGSKMNRTKIKTIVKEYCGCECFPKLTDTQLIIDMTFNDDPALYMDNIREFLNNSTIPAHIEIVYHGMMDFSIVSELIEKMYVPKIINKMEFSLYRASKYLDGSSRLDGSKLLNSVHGWFQTSIGNILLFPIQEQFVAQTVFLLENDIKSQYGQIMSNGAEVCTTEKITCNSKLNLLSELQAACEFSVTIKKNLRYLDGSKQLDGTTLLNSYIKKEEL